MKTPKISIIVATDLRQGIGRTELGVGKLLWHIPDDLKRFKRLTTGHPVIMGRKTFESILSYRDKPLPNRTNIVLTRHPLTHNWPNCIRVNNFDEAFMVAKQSPGGAEEIFIIGGAQIYNQALEYTDRLYLTLVENKYEADTFFPDYSDFKKVVSEEKRETEEGLKYSWLTLER